MSCDFSKVKAYNHETVHELTSWSAYQDAAYKQHFKSTSNIVKAVLLLDKEKAKTCKVHVTNSDELNSFPMYVLAKYPATYKQWLSMTPAQIVKEIKASAAKYIDKLSYGNSSVVYSLKGNPQFPSKSAIAKIKSATRKSATRKSATRKSATRKSAPRKSATRRRSTRRG